MRRKPNVRKLLAIYMAGFLLLQWIVPVHRLRNVSSTLEGEPVEDRDLALGRSAGEEEEGAMGEEPDEIVLGEGEKVVYSFSQLQSALKDDSTTTIYLGADIATTSGTEVNAAKPYLILDGINPLDESGEIHTLTEYNASGEGDTIRLLSNSGLKEVTIENMKVIGANHFGFFSIADGVKNAVLTYRNVEYQGPQMTFHRYGLTRYLDCRAEIGQFRRASSPGELGEVWKVELGGRVEVRQAEAQANEIFFFPIGGYRGKITVLEGAEVEISTFSASGFTYAEMAVDLVLERDASLRFTARDRVWEYYPYRDVTLEPGAELIMEVTGTLPNSLLRIDGDLVVGEDAVLHLYQYGSTFPCLAINGGTAEFENPRSVILYSGGIRPLYYGAEGEWTVRAQQLNYWRAAAPDGFGNPPLYSWKRTDGADVTMEATMDGGAAGGITLTSNSEGGDFVQGIPLDSATFHPVSARVIAFGRLPLDLFYQNGAGDETQVLVETLPQALVNAYVSQNVEIGEEFPLGEGVRVDETGRLYFETQGGSLPLGTRIRAQANRWYLFEEASVVTGESRLGFLEPPENIKLAHTVISAGQVEAPRAMDAYRITVSDTRALSEGWRLTVELQSPLRPQGREHRPIEGALFFRDGQGRERYLTEEEPVLVYRHIREPGQVEEIVEIDWEENEGILARIPPGEGLAEVPYTARILWYLEDVP